jgi:hypothetical protein
MSRTIDSPPHTGDGPRVGAQPDGRDMVAGITGWALRHKRLVVACWLALTILGMAFAKKATDALTQEYSVPNHQSSQ